MSDLVKRLRSGAYNEEPVAVRGVEHDRRCLEAADEIERLRAPHIKPLEWHKECSEIIWEIWHSECLIGTFVLTRLYPQKAFEVYDVRLDGQKFIYQGPSLEEAKAAAEEEYRNRIMSVLMEE